MKKVTLLILGLVAALAFQAGSAFASSTKLDSVIDELIGVNYSYGGTTTAGFDCSGFTSYVFKKLGISLTRTSRSQAEEGDEVEKSELIEGDLVFFNTSGKGISHVGIYVGNGKFAHASTSKGVVITDLDDSYYAKRYVTARRVMTSEQYEKLAKPN
ncbi:C40 family peptidase [Paenibacillus cisolokensis]|uniref:NlpC/P60 domain-containing protein n=1 Tax=Paenibacillus cisolokensis TaxID=1658519 RepID=A0ABQ4NBN2_9BACL|nr:MULTISPECIES: C40 family peptidase [Paenibacillus]ALS25672.1 hydrolase [Paenibacillus sp. 32O-W]GIQ65638.1 hypothetical protein PACILC2_42060 [Paenibacillus cisolokensis]